MDDESFVLMGALWFRPDGGAEKYDEYLAAAKPFADKHGLGPNNEYVPVETIRGDLTPDLVFFNEHPSEEGFTALRQDPGYRAVVALREEAVERQYVLKLRRK